MKFLIFSMLLGASLIAGDLQVKSGSVSALTGVLGDSKVDPKFDSINAKLSMDGDDLKSIRGTISVEMAKFKSENADRDENMHETLESEKFAMSNYTINGVEATESPDTYVLKGELELHGVIRPLDFNAKITQDDSTVSIDAKTQINVEDYKIDMPCLLGFTMCVDENVNIDGVVVLNKN
ncbi:YceI family protein [Sulfurimonas sp.]|uniref:YceI family protein n=1 Tax=Sulfurimonas sp. TaxID=2022749 RepID=UPI0035624751